MAIIRQQTQVFNRPVRVVRAESGAEAPMALARAASQISDMAFQEAAVYAEEVGKKAGLARATSDIVSIDPETGEPVAYNAPRGFGGIAARAYRDVIDRRFEDSVISEMKERASFISTNSANAEQYKERMASYIESMHGQAKNQQGEQSYYVRFVKETGEKYLASTYLALRKREAEAARKTTIKKSTIDLGLGIRETGKLIISGADQSEINQRLLEHRSHVQSLFEADGLTSSGYLKKLEEIDTLSSQNSNNRLIRYFAGLSPENQALVTLALNDPTQASEIGIKLGKPDLSTMIVDARIGSSISSIQESFSSISSSVQEVAEDKVEAAYSEEAPHINGKSSFSDVDELAARYDAEVREAVGAELSAKLVNILLDESGDSVKGINTIVSELKKASPDYASIGQLVGGVRGPELASRLKAMNPKQRDSIVKAIEGRRTSMSGLEASAESETIMALKDRGVALRDEKDLVAVYDQLVSDTIASGSPQTDTMLTNFRNKFVDEAMIQVDNIEIKSLDRFEAVANGIKDKDFKPQSPEEEQMLALLRRSYDINPSQVDRTIASYRNRIEYSNKLFEEGSRLAGIQTAIDEGRSTTKEDLKFYEDKILPEGSPRDLTTLLQNQAVLYSVNRGYVLPSVATAMESALLGMNEAETVQAIQTFERLSKFQGITERGVPVKIDKMQQALSPNAYALYSAASYVSRLEKNIEPIVVLSDLKAYEGNLDEDIREGLGLKKDQPLSDAFVSVPMSKNYKKEILAVMRVAKSRGAQIDQDFVDNLIESYENDPERAKDDSVYGIYFGDKTLYARHKHLSNDEIVTHREELFDKISQHPEFSKLLTGGTPHDSFFAFFNSETGLAALLEDAFGGPEYQEKASDNLRLRKGLQTLGVELKYMPIVDSFEGDNANPTWIVGFETKAKGFQPFMFNGELEVIQAGKKTGTTRGEVRLQNTNNLNVVVRSPNATDKDKVDAYLGSLATREHMSVDSIKKTDYFYLVKEVYGEDWVEVYNKLRSEYEALPQ